MEEYLYSAIYYASIVSKRSDMDHSFTCKYHGCLSFVSVHQMALPLANVADDQLELTIQLWTPMG